MGLPPIVLKQANAHFYGFAGYNEQPYGGVKLLITIGNHPAQAIVLANFLVVDTPLIYNAIIGRLTLNELQVVASTYHLVLNF